MGFWDKALGGTPAPQQPAQAPTAYQRAWWMPEATPQPQIPQGQYQQQPQQQQVPQGDPTFTNALMGIGIDVNKTKAKSAKFEGGCPECNSPNYFPIGKQTNVKTGMTAETMRCYDCGFPIVQSASGDTMPSRGGSREGSIVAARQNDPSGFHGDQIVGRV